MNKNIKHTLTAFILGAIIALGACAKKKSDDTLMNLYLLSLIMPKSSSSSCTNTGTPNFMMVVNSTTNPVIWSNDGSCWNATTFKPNVSTNAGNLTLRSIGYGNDGYVVFGDASQISNTTAAPLKSWRSNLAMDGFDFSDVSVTGSSGIVSTSKVLSGTNRVVAYSFSGAPSGSIIHSTDKVNWTTLAGGNSLLAYGTVNSQTGYFSVSVSGTSISLKLSTDNLASWTTLASGTADQSCSAREMAIGNNLIVILCDGAKALISSDLSTFSLKTVLSSATSPSAGRDITFGNGKFIAAFDSGTGLLSSTDGVVWTQITLPNITSTEVATEVAYGSSGFVVASNGHAWYSTDGMTFTQSQVTTGELISAISLAAKQ